MDYRIKRSLKKSNNKKIFQDVKTYLNNSHDFYHLNVPEIRTLGKKLHEEHSLKEFYKIFNKLWNGSMNENALALYALGLYQEEFNTNTWKFIKPKLKKIKSWDQADRIAKDILSSLILKYSSLEKEIFELSSKNNWIKRMALISSISLIKKERTKLSFYLIKKNYDCKEEKVQKAIGYVLKELKINKPKLYKNLIEKYSFSETSMKVVNKDIKKKRGFLFWKK